MVANAKSFNQRDSEIWANAERIRKITSQFMRKHNPAYDDPTYEAFPTPLPEELNGNRASQKNGRVSTEESSMAGEPPATAEQNQAIADRAQSRDAVRFEGLTFQKAQEMLLEELFRLRDHEYVRLTSTKKQEKLNGRLPLGANSSRTRSKTFRPKILQIIIPSSTNRCV